MHEHQTAVRERVAVALTQGAGGGSTDMGKDQGGGGLLSETREVGAVPSGGSGGEDAWLV